MEKLIITIAPTGNVPEKSMTPHVPVTPDEIAADIVACYQQGAAVAHIHARDEAGKPTAALTYFAEIIQKIDQAGCPIIKQISTGARAGKTAEARAEALILKPDSASLATGSSNFPHSANLNEPSLIEYLAKTMLDNKIKPEIEVFDAAMISNAVALRKRGYLTGRLQFNLVLGVKGSLPATPKNLFFLVESLPPDSIWSVSIVGAQHVNLSVMAMALGGHVRVGVEDNMYYSKGVLATNVALVERIAAIANAMGREFATPADVRRIWGI
ncbi:3-keto-5-aminohexanoate cleavage protein [Sporomusa acidovorans]|uniref:3-keto-5-aminohexanoate cleavage enzyme n=1 Tax=Sporomusa acidovorans (strain ATCC 49682 / DSM 3132 / Mol) TaxID=1123286 RepID=A0ABZ3J205_SPOA4|nr:3-keto-5-aminohexanoate cleavage protein [Sporomusa acidovorans]OZC13622.1 3-keto-5-aminohexanoate cleavage enzyme [Sporomusa acidovorans DSM 3132]SDE86605.1 3-keto-5-aminohexanoate cleavage enzyme [Sporomusa acidovorans]